jgi:glycosyltransferase involved in cell wall biosynthesis
MSQCFSNVSIVIPSNHCHNDLIILINAINNQTIKPTEIIVVDSSLNRGNCPAEISSQCAFNGINFIYEYRSSALPGEARNIGISRTSSRFIALLDVETIPLPDWLDKSLRMLATDDVLGVWGATIFSAETKFERLVRDGLFGIHPRKTLPGSVFKREVFKKTGEFINWVRAGEDTEWMLRVEVHRIRVVTTTNTLVNYTGLIGADAQQLIKKWHRNYTMSSTLPHLFPQKVLLWLVVYPVIILLAFNWNYLIADWQIDSPLYLGHITKTMVILPIFIYVISRGFLIPLKRGVSIFQLLPIRFLGILLVCMISDGVKGLVFSLPINNKNKIKE